MPSKKDQRRDRPPAVETPVKTPGYGLAKGSGIGKPEGKLSRDGRRKLERVVEADALGEALDDAEEMRTDSESEEEPTPPTAGTPGDGVFRISFIQMGKGDCTIMCTPQGKIIVIDCGSSDHEGELNKVFAGRVKGVLQSAAYLRNTMTIDAVILTHSDNDHWGQFNALLKGFTPLAVYHSGTIGTYAGGGRWAQMHVVDEKAVKQVILNKDDTRGENTLNGQPIPSAPSPGVPEWLETDVGLVVVSEPNCKITLVAAGVAHKYVDDTETDPTNRGSIVTLIEVSEKKFLISADATRATEAFLMLNATRKARLSGVHYVQAGHHGSQKTSSMQSWVDHVRPVEKVIVSAPKAGKPKHALPRAEVIHRYLQRFAGNGRAADTATHRVSAWNPAVDKSKPEEWDADQPVYTIGISGTQTISVS
jgi:beta-lactamase superfamily II metal-dependent hydrolase